MDFKLSNSVVTFGKPAHKYHPMETPSFDLEDHEAFRANDKFERFETEESYTAE
jgi:hypothetical protein